MKKEKVAKRSGSVLTGAEEEGEGGEAGTEVDVVDDGDG
jgi:hypothetical protein